MKMLEYLVRRSPRERWTWGIAALAVVALACYMAGVAPPLESLEGIEEDLATTETGLELQQRQLQILKAETTACEKVLADLKDVPCPWVPAAEADAHLQRWQREAAELGLTVRSVIRERQSDLRLGGEKAPVSILVVRLELHGPYAAVMAMLQRLGQGDAVTGLEELTLKGLDEPPYDVELVVLVRLAVGEGDSHA